MTALVIFCVIIFLIYREIIGAHGLKNPYSKLFKKGDVLAFERRYLTGVIKGKVERVGYTIIYIRGDDGFGYLFDPVVDHISYHTRNGVAVSG